MNKSESIVNLAPALVKAQAEIKSAQKTGDNKFDKYRYSKLEDFFDAAKPTLAKHGLSLVIGVNFVERLPDRQTKSGGSEHACQVSVSITLLHASGEWIEAAGFGEGQDRADKSIYKAITGAKKYAIAGLLAIPTTDDPEADESVGQAPPVKKMDSNGNTVSAKPKWTDEQTLEAGGYVADIIKLPGGEREVSTLRTRMKYDQPADVIDALAALKQTLAVEE